MRELRESLTKRLTTNSFYRFVLSYSTFVVILFSAFVQILFIGKYLDNSIISPYAPTAMDALDYTSRAEIWRSRGFSEAFTDVSRMPGYPFLIYINNLLFSEYTYLATRCFQLLTLAVSVGLIKIVLQKYTSQAIAVFTSGLFAFLPIWHFIPILIGETLTAVIIIALIYLLSKIHNREISLKYIFMISICIAIETYLKPNNILIIIPIIGFLIFSKQSKVLRSTARILFFVLILLLPWIGFASSAQKGFLGLTANSGINAYIGTGMIISYDGGILAKSAIKWKVDPKSNASDIVAGIDKESPIIRNNLFAQKSIQIWKNRFWAELGFGFDKIRFAFGLNSESKLESIFGIFNILGLLSALLLLKDRALRSWGIALLLIAMTLSIQAIIFQADRRFVIPVFSPFAIVCLGIVFHAILRGISSRTAPNSE